MFDNQVNITLETVRDLFPSFKAALKYLEKLHSALDTNRNLMLSIFLFLYKESMEFMKYQHPEPMTQRDSRGDRIFPLETIKLQSYKTDHEKEAASAIIHVGPAADEFARSLNALAVTIANDIYFRNAAYRPESEEGRKLLAHELTHVSQYEGKRIEKHTDKAELEAEAVKSEEKEKREGDPYVSVEAGGEVFTFRESEMDRITSELANSIVDWVEAQKNELEEREYLELLCNYREWLKEEA